MYANAPPIPPPKPASHDTSRMGTPTTSQSPRPRPPPPPPLQDGRFPAGDDELGLPAAAREPVIALPQDIPDPGDQWLPRYLEDKSKQDLAEILASPALQSALTHAPQTAHPSLAAGQAALAAALQANVALAAHVGAAERAAAAARGEAQARLVGAHALEHQWRLKQAAMDRRLAPFAPAGLYQRLGAAVGEQEAVCRALEESFLEAGGGGGGGGAGGGGGGGHGDGPDGNSVAPEREVLEWVKRYREAKKLYYLRQERKERWDEGRVGGWR